MYNEKYIFTVSRLKIVVLLFDVAATNYFVCITDVLTLAKITHLTNPTIIGQAINNAPFCNPFLHNSVIKWCIMGYWTSAFLGWNYSTGQFYSDRFVSILLHNHPIVILNDQRSGCDHDMKRGYIMNMTFNVLDGELSVSSFRIDEFMGDVVSIELLLVITQLNVTEAKCNVFKRI